MMGVIRFFCKMTTYAWKALCQQLWLLAGLFMLFLLLPVCAGPVGDALFSRGVEFSGITLAVVAPQGDDTGAVLERLTEGMRDVREYASLRSMTREEAQTALESGEVSAILLLPERFVDGILEGENPDVTLVVSPDRPLEALLTAWVGSSAADLLTASQRGIYAVLELAPGENRDQMMLGINLEFIQRTLNRERLFKTRQLRVAGAMELGEYYGLSVLSLLALCLPPLFDPVFRGEDIRFRRRLRSLGYGAAFQTGSCVLVCGGVVFLLTAAPVWYLTGNFPVGAGMLALFSGSFSAVCCLASYSASGCGGMAFPAALGLTFLSGGIVPTALLPGWIVRLGRWLPLGALRTLMALPVSEWSREGWALLCALGWSGMLWVLAVLLFACRLKGEVEA